MINILKQWYERYFTDPQTVIFAFILIFGFLLIVVMNAHLMPILIGIIIAYLFEGLVVRMGQINLNRTIAASFATALILTAIVLTLFVLLPLLSRQVTELIRDLPSMLGEGQQLLSQLPQKYPDFVSTQQVEEILTFVLTEVTLLGQRVVSLSLASVVGVITFFVYLILLPLMVFFFLKDKELILGWLGGFLPDERRLAREVWADLDIKIASYVRGKFLEILIIWITSFIAFSWMGLNYAMLLSLLVGISVIVPYVGATVVTIPVALIAFSQWGVTTDFVYLIAIYALIQFLDGNLLVPLLFSEVVNLHPIAIIVSVVFFGSLWGIWGVFFAIPLATFIQAVIKAWPTHETATD
ncbi:MAG: AI-2E family transporter [Gammaproteobacteria bacterium]|nr:MAG: AI-2E family transporter [Gammaproteobacteria bacterium]